MTDVHPIATGGYGRSADSYVRGRPDYPPAALDWLRSDLGLGPGQTALELGSGTGKFTRLLVETGADIAAVEPVAAMLDELRRSLPAVTALQGTAQRIPAADASADAVICAQAFHWFASADSLAEIHRVLKPGGMLGLIWNVRDQSVGWVAELTRIMAPYEGDARSVLLAVQREEPAPAGRVHRGLPADLQAIMRDVEAVNQELKAAGAWVYGGGLEPQKIARVARMKAGAVQVTDGPFAETKEFLGGFCIITAPDLDTALEWAGKFARATTLPIEVRPFQHQA